MRTNKRYIIGIDPGRNTGIAVWDRQKKAISETHTFDFWGAFEYMQSFAPKLTSVIIETPNAKRFVYKRHDGEGVNEGMFYRDKLAANVGSNRREATLLADGIEQVLGFEVTRVTPTRKKWSASDLKRHTGITARTNEHVRDAIRLCFGF